MLQPNEFKIYNASAGAGKTYTLVKEYLSILLSNTNPFAYESILAITFTNKAANEMKERILQQLVKFSQPDFAENSDLKNLSKELEISPEEMHLRSKNVLVKILHNYSRFSVSTIDKFNLRLMKAFAQDLGLSSNFNVEMEQEKLFEESVHQLFAKIGEDELLTSVLIDIALDNLNDNKTWDISRDLVKTASTLYNDTHLVPLAKLQKYNLEEFNEFRKTVFSKTAQKKNALKNNASEFIQLITENGVSIGDFASEASGIGGYFKKFLNEDFAYPTQTHLKNIENTDPKKFTSGKADPSLNLIIENIFPRIQQLFYDAVKIQKDLPLWEGIQKTIVSMSIINEVEKSIDLLKEDQNVLLISEFNKRISSGLQKQPSGFIYERIGNRFHHYFIDEFQDTSTLQWQNLLPLIENARAGSDTVMLVGDAKQSIYRWRGGNPEQMMNLVENHQKLDINVENLPKNWRSHENIIAFNNSFYQNIANDLKIEAYQKLYFEGNNQEKNDKKGGYVQLNFISKKDETIEDYNYHDAVLAQLLENIQSVKNQGFQLNEITILHSTKKLGKLIAEFLTKNEIPLISSESLLLKNADEIEVLELFFKTISNEEDKISKTLFLLKFNQLKNQIFPEITQSIQSVLDENQTALKVLLDQFGFDISFAFEPSVSMYDFVEKSIQYLELNGKADAYLQYFLDYVLEYSMSNEYNFQRFLEHWESKKDDLSISPPDGIDAVQLMTIHKSKGLEFPVVMLPFADWGDRKNYPNFWIPIDDPELPFDEFLVKSYGKLDQVNDEISAKITEEHQEFLLDNLNMLYVATTRAVEQLYILTERKESKDKDKLKTGVSQYFNSQFPTGEEIAVIGEKVRNSEPENEKTIAENLDFTSENWENRIEISRESSKRWKKKKEIVYGELIHEMMKEIHSEKDLDKVLKKALISGEIKESERDELKNKMISIVQHPELKAHFDENLKSLNERDFLDENGEIFRPDRLVLDGNSCIIIDYKTGGESAKHIAQINYYAENLAKSGYQIALKFLVYIGNEIEVKEVN